MPRIISAAFFLVALAASSALSQDSAATLKDRMRLQSAFINTFVQQHDSLSLAKDGRCKPFESTAEIDAYMHELQASWGKRIGNAESVMKRLDSYLFFIVERSKAGGEWSLCYVKSKYMLPNFLADVEYCRRDPTPDKASLMWIGVLSNVFFYPVECEMPPEEWKQLSTAYGRLPILLDTWLAAGTHLDSN